MATVLAGLRPGKITIEMREQRARNMRLAVLRLAHFRLCEIVPANEHPPFRMRGELRGADQGFGHPGILRYASWTSDVMRLRTSSACSGRTCGARPCSTRLRP